MDMDTFGLYFKCLMVRFVGLNQIQDSEEATRIRVDQDN